MPHIVDALAYLRPAQVRTIHSNSPSATVRLHLVNQMLHPRYALSLQSANAREDRLPQHCNDTMNPRLKE